VIRWRAGEVVAVRRQWPGAVEIVVAVGGQECPALAYPALVGLPRLGDRVLLNTTAYALGLGTGGYAIVVALPDRLPPDRDEPGHLVKARYTPAQVSVLGVDEQSSPVHALLAEADDLGGMPVVVADLHSALPAVLVGAHLDAPDVRVAYVMSDGGALPLWFSHSVAALTAAGRLAGTVTVGQAFGGDLEAVTLHTGLLAARLVLGADVAVVSQGPGNLGSGTRWGYSGVAVGEAANAVATLRGRPVGCLRISSADLRPRHRGLSHHSRTAFGRVALAPADLAVPDLAGSFWDDVRRSVAELAPPHRSVAVPVTGLAEALVAAPVPLSTMGRGLDEDREYFLAAAAAGRHAVALLDESKNPRSAADWPVA